METGEKTTSDGEWLRVIAGQLEHLTADVHHLIERLDRIDRLVTEFEPIVRLYASPVSAYTASRRARKEARDRDATRVQRTRNPHGPAREQA